MDVSTIRGEKRFVKTSHEKVIDKEVEGRRMRMKEGKSKRTRERERETEREKNGWLGAVENCEDEKKKEGGWERKETARRGKQRRHTIQNRHHCSRIVDFWMPRNGNHNSRLSSSSSGSSCSSCSK